MSGSVIAAIDFGTSNGDDSFQVVTDLGVAGHELRRLPPPGMDGHPMVEVRSSAFATHYERLLNGGARAPAAIAGYCVGGVFAGELAVRLRRGGWFTGPTVLVDTIPPVARQVTTEFVRGFRAMGWREEAMFGVDLRAIAAWAAVDPAGRLPAMAEAARRFITAFLAAHGASDESAASLTETMLRRTTSWLRYVAAAAVRDAPFVDEATHVIASRQLADAAEAAWGPTGARVHRVACDHAEVLRSEATHRQLAACLADWRGDEDVTTGSTCGRYHRSRSDHREDGATVAHFER